MGDFSIGAALFVLIIVIGLIVGLRLSSTSPQRRAVVAAFAAMILVAALFWAVAMSASQIWTAPFFALACIVVPLAAYMGVMKAAKTAQASSRRREEPTKRVRTELSGRAVKAGSAVDNALMPVAPNHPVNEFRSLRRPLIEEDEKLPAEATTADEAVSDFREAADGPVAGSLDTDVVAAAELEVAASSESEQPTEAVDVDREAGVEGDGRFGEGEAEGSSSVAACSNAGDPKAGDPKADGLRAEAFIEEYLIDQNESSDGMFEPEAAPSLNPPPGPSHTTSTMMLTVPFAEGDERYLVVSDTETVPNPILAFKRTTSSHLVPLGPQRRANRPKHAAASEESVSVAPAIPEAVSVPEPAAEVPFALRPRVSDPDATAEVDFAALFRVKEESKETRDSQLALDFTAQAISAEPTFAATAVPAATLISAPAATPKPAPAPEPAAVPVSAPVATPAPAPAPVAAPAPAVEPGIASAQPQGIEVPAGFVPAAPSPASTREARFEEFLAKARNLRDKGLYPVAARLYGEAAAAAEGADARRARFEEMACYVKAGQHDKARSLAAELRTSSVLTRVERIKLDAVERMG